MRHATTRIRLSAGVLAAAVLAAASAPVPAGGIADAVRESLSRGADPNALFRGEFFKVRPLHTVVGETDDHLEAARLLLEAGADPDGRDELGETPLHKAARKLAWRYARLLLEHGADPNAKDKEGETPLHELASEAGMLSSGRGRNGDLQRIRAGLPRTAATLLEHGADPDVADSQGRTPLARVVGMAPAALVKVLLERGADPNRRDRRGASVLRRAATDNPDPEVTGLLLEHGADAGDVDLLVDAIEGRFPENALRLIRHGAPVKGVARSGESPLHAAVSAIFVRGKSEARKEVIRELLARGAPPDSPGPMGATARGSAERDPEILALFGVPPRHAEEKPVAAAASRPATAAVPEDIVAKLMERVDAALDRQRDARGAAHRAADLTTLKSRDEVGSRIRALKTYREALSRTLGTLAGVSGEAGRMAGKQGFGPDRIEETGNRLADALFARGEPALSAFCKAERAWVDALLAGYRLLAEYPNAWSPGAGSGKAIRVHEESFAEQFGRLAQRIAVRAEAAREARDALRTALSAAR